jgi:septal ring factor EnvC (AmiA/AmiB activator)
MLAAAFGFTIVVAQQQPRQAERERTEALTRRATERLQSLHAEADRLASEERTLLGDLRRLEVEREIRATELAEARRSADAARAEVERLDAEIARLNTENVAALPDLEGRLVTLYKLGRGRYARLLLSASDLRQFGQAVRLVSVLAEQDRQRLAQHRRRLSELADARQAAQDRRARLVDLRAAAQKAQGAADQALAAQQQMVRDIDARRDLNAQYSAELLTAQQRLQSSLANFGTTAPALPVTPFKGDLPWPAVGSLRHQFGAAVGGRPPLRGIEIATAPEADVRAVHGGTVAYADVFSGYGRLVIVEHGNQAFTLYGNLGTIAVSKGAHVEPGQLVGTAGLADRDAAVVYFELRVDGRAVDPLQWLAKR